MSVEVFRPCVGCGFCLVCEGEFDMYEDCVECGQACDAEDLDAYGICTDCNARVGEYGSDEDEFESDNVVFGAWEVAGCEEPF